MILIKKIIKDKKYADLSIGHKKDIEKKLEKKKNVIAVGNDWEFSIGLYGGLVIGFRHYVQKNCTDYVLYLPLIDFCLTIYHD